MTLLTLALVVVLAVVALVVWGRRRLVVAQRQLEELEAFRAELGMPADRFRVVDVSLAESIGRGLLPRARLPRFEDVHRVCLDPAVQADLLTAVRTDPGAGERP